ncbi:putative zinc finger MYM-type protein 1-like [Diplonema papillatum]|nr:putative zinc finger MYM-type protein 1-like [Diplonema papillatum]KAJ9445449.1 putative zinc finger MYM-type protein 1-like [Diplonema papillatum]KAJ9445615.1 putative zinc finger MYM-type protein 1-like [Diplonema papillatum]KAJ9452568.1 putative zinc finger MYM-type protein 1-like [Diplonema papillatum]KAJ9467320.1 putative zinc finger MYM-type protein 1-like [Diplonema papillatum]
MNEFETLAAFGIYDPRNPNYDDLVLARSKLDVLTAHYCEGKSFQLMQDDGRVVNTAVSPPYFSSEVKAGLEEELCHVLPAIKETVHSVDLAVCSFSEIIRAFLRETANRLAYPHTARLLTIPLAIPLTTAGAERLFSKLRLVKDRLSSRLNDTSLQGYMTVSTEGSITADGIPNDVLSSYVETFTSGERKLAYTSLEDLKAAQEHAMTLRKSCEKSWWI